jgi:hypothetical protein
MTSQAAYITGIYLTLTDYSHHIQLIEDRDQWWMWTSVVVVVMKPRVLMASLIYTSSVKLHTEELQNVCSLPSTVNAVRVMNRTCSIVGVVRNVYKILSVNLKGRHHFETYTLMGVQH